MLAQPAGNRREVRYRQDPNSSTFDRIGELESNGEVGTFRNIGNNHSPAGTESSVKKPKNTIAGSVVRAGIVTLPEHYLYSSAVNYAGNAGVLEVALMDATGLVSLAQSLPSSKKP